MTNKNKEDLDKAIEWVKSELAGAYSSYQSNYQTKLERKLSNKIDCLKIIHTALRKQLAERDWQPIEDCPWRRI